MVALWFRDHLMAGSRMPRKLAEIRGVIRNQDCLPECKEKVPVMTINSVLRAFLGQNLGTRKHSGTRTPFLSSVPLAAQSLLSTL